jgi:hypothetical protein
MARTGDDGNEPVRYLPFQDYRQFLIFISIVSSLILVGALTAKWIFAYPRDSKSALNPTSIQDDLRGERDVLPSPTQNDKALPAESGSPQKPAPAVGGTNQPDDRTTKQPEPPSEK